MEPTKDHKIIRNWAQSRSATPARVSGTDDGVPAVLRFIVPGAHTSNRNLEEISWEHFFAKFDVLNLSFVFQQTTSTGEMSSVNDIVQVLPQMVDHRNWN